MPFRIIEMILLRYYHTWKSKSKAPEFRHATIISKYEAFKIWEGLLSEGYLRLRFEGLTFGRAFFFSGGWGKGDIIGILRCAIFFFLPGSGRERNVRIWRHSLRVFIGETKRIKLLQNINDESIERVGIFVSLSVNVCKLIPFIIGKKPLVITPTMPRVTAP